MKAQEIIEHIEEVAPQESGVEGDENGVVFGDVDDDANGIGIAWIATILVIREAFQKGLISL